MNRFRFTVNFSWQDEPKWVHFGVAKTPKALLPVDARIAALLAKAVGAARLSQRDLASLTGMSQNRLSTILRGDSPPATVGEVGTIAEAVGTTASAIIGAAEIPNNITPIGSRNVGSRDVGSRDVGSRDEDQTKREAAFESEVDHDEDHDDYDA